MITPDFRIRENIYGKMQEEEEEEVKQHFLCAVYIRETGCVHIYIYK